MKKVKFFKVFRPPLNLPGGPMVHFGIAAVDQQTGQTWVLHNTPERGEYVSTITEFAAGLHWHYEELPEDLKTKERFVAVANSPKIYDLMMNNCQHTANKIASGVAWSPGLWIAGFIALGIGIYLVKDNVGAGTV